MVADLSCDNLHGCFTSLSLSCVLPDTREARTAAPGGQPNPDHLIQTTTGDCSPWSIPGGSYGRTGSTCPSGGGGSAEDGEGNIHSEQLTLA